MGASMRPRFVMICTLAALLSASAAARADTSAARKHFEAGKKLRDGGDCLRAIPEFDKSLAADASVGGYYNLGYCHEQLAQRQEAYEAYKRAQALASAKKDERLREVSGALAALLETPHIRLVLPKPLPEGLRITVDDRLVPEAFYATETVVFTSNAKHHSVRVTAPGFEERREVVETKGVKPIELRPPPEETAAPAPTPMPAPPPREQARGWTWQHWTGVGLAGAGLVTGVVALAFVLDYLGERSDLDKRIADQPCGPDVSCQQNEALDRPETPQNEHDDAVARAALLRAENNRLESDITLKGYSLGAIGGGLIVAGVVVYLLAPSASASAAAESAAEPRSDRVRFSVVPRLGPRERGLSLVGTF